MADLPVNFAACEETLDEVRQRVLQNTKRLRQARDLVDQAVADLGSIPTQYADFINEIDAQAGNLGWSDLAARKQRLTADYQQVQTTAQAVSDALPSIP